MTMLYLNLCCNEVFYKGYVRPLIKSAYQKIIFLISQPKRMLWVLKPNHELCKLPNSAKQHSSQSCTENLGSIWTEIDKRRFAPLFICIAYSEFLLHFVMPSIQFQLLFWIINLGKYTNTLTNLGTAEPNIPEGPEYENIPTLYRCMGRSFTNSTHKQRQL